VSTESLSLERRLRDALRDVQLVCEAEIADEDVAAAEILIRERLAHRDYEALSRRFPGALIAYFVLRGAEVYEGNQIWPQLGVTENSSRAGRAFLDALARVGLPDFTDEVEAVGGRTYVGPLLIHGALPSSVARQLVDCVEEALRCGVVNSKECRERILQRPDIVDLLRRPASRMLDWCPSYAERLLDAVIDYIEEPSGSAIDRLPRHIRTALGNEAERRGQLRRLKVPRVEFDWWSGLGPQVRGVEGRRWVVATADESQVLAGDICLDLSPAAAAQVVGEGRQFNVWSASGLWFFDLSGRLVPSESSLPEVCAVLLPRDWMIWTGEGTRVEEMQAGALLSGVWSDFRSAVVRLESRIFVGPTHETSTNSRDVSVTRHPHLVDDPSEEVALADGSPVHTALPLLRIPYVPDPVPVRVRVTSPGGSSSACDLAPQAASRDYDLSTAVPAGPASVVIQVPGSPDQVPLTVVPGLTIERSQSLLGPGEPTAVSISYLDAAHHAQIEKVHVEPYATEATFALRGLAHPLVVPVPRLLWTVRSSRTARLQFSTGVIRADTSDLITHDLWLLARSGIPFPVGAVLKVNGIETQVVEPSPMKRTGVASHQISIRLDQFRDTIRRNDDQHLEVQLVVEGVAFTALECGTRPVDLGERVWAEGLNAPARSPDTGVLEQIKGFGPKRAPATGEPRLTAHLRSLDTADAVVSFLRLLGERQAGWLRSEFPSGASANDWRRFDSSADALWSLTSHRQREFGDIEHVGRWGRRMRERLRTAPKAEMDHANQWILRACPRRVQIENWELGRYVDTLLSSRDTTDATWLPGLILYHSMALVAGDDLSASLVHEAVALQPEISLMSVALVMQILWQGDRITSPPDASESADESAVEGDVNDVMESWTLPTLGSLAGCEVSVAPGSVVLTPQTPCGAPTVRVVSRGRAVATVRARPTERAFVLDLPADVSGELGLQIVQPRQVSHVVKPDLAVVVPTTARSPERQSSVTLRTFDDLEQQRLHELTLAIASVAATGVMPRDLVDELFDDERAAARTLASMKDSGTTVNQRDLALIACAPAAFLFSSLGLDSRDLGRDLLKFAVLADRRPDVWTEINWPNGKAFGIGGGWSALRGFVRTLGYRTARPIDVPTFRYQSSVQDYPNSSHLDSAIAELTDGIKIQLTDPTFIDLVIAAHRLVSVDRLVDEAMRLLIAAYHADARMAKAAIVCGLAAALACQDS
jgi:hypothetical protein